MRPAAEQSGIGDRVVRRAKRALRHQRLMGRQRAGYAVNLGHLEGLFERQRRQNRRHALRQHCLARARRADRQQVVASRHGDFNGPFGGFLPLYVREILVVKGGFSEGGGRVHCQRSDRQTPGDEVRRLAQRVHRIYRQPLDHRRFLGVFRRDEDACAPFAAGAQRDGQHPPHSPHVAAQRQLADHAEPREVVGVNLARRRQHAEGDRQVETRTFLADVGGGEVDGDAPHRRLKRRVQQRGHHPVAALFYGRIRKSNDDDLEIAMSGVDFNLHRIGIHPQYRRRKEPCEHAVSPPRRARAAVGGILRGPVAYHKRRTGWTVFSNRRPSGHVRDLGSAGVLVRRRIRTPRLRPLAWLAFRRDKDASRTSRPTAHLSPRAARCAAFRAGAERGRSRRAGSDRP